MKMLFVHERFGALAGAEANAYATAVELARRGHDLSLLHGARTGRGESEWDRVFSGRCLPLPSTHPAEATRHALQVSQPDVIYVHNMADLKVLETLLASDVPAARMVHDHGLYCMRSYKYNCITRRICTRPVSPFCLVPCAAFLKRSRDSSFPLAWVSYSKKKNEITLNRKFHRLLVATNYMKEELLRNGFESSRVEVHPPVPPKENATSPIPMSDRNLIIYAGQITRGKGVDVLLESLAKVRAPFECLIFGDGHYRGYCEQLSQRLGLSQKVRFGGFVSQDELKNYYRECRVAVVSSVWPEPFGAVGLEAMRFGVPVVAFDAGGISEWLIDGHNGFLVPWMDRTAFAAKVETLLRDKSLARLMGVNGFELIRQRFDFSKYVDGIENLFSNLVAELHAAQIK